MSSKSMILLAFAGWGIFSTWYYLCKIKQVCGTRTDVEIAAITSPAVVENAVQPLENEEDTPSAPNSSDQNLPAPRPVESDDINRVSVVRTAAGDAVEIHFPYNSTDKEENPAIDEYLMTLANQLKNSGAHIVIAGHTDGIGDASSNLKISDRRAKSIRDILMKKGVAASQIRTKAFGESQPKASNDHPKGRYENRRVEIKIVE